MEVGAATAHPVTSNDSRLSAIAGCSRFKADRTNRTSWSSWWVCYCNDRGTFPRSTSEPFWARRNCNLLERAPPFERWERAASRARATPGEESFFCPTRHVTFVIPPVKESPPAYFPRGASRSLRLWKVVGDARDGTLGQRGFCFARRKLPHDRRILCDGIV